MARVEYKARAGRYWQLNTADDDGAIFTTDAQLAVLMDIREELKTLNALLGCRNFTDIPTVLHSIRRNTISMKKPKRRPRGR